MFKLNLQSPQEMPKYPQAAGDLKDFREFILTEYFEETLRELRVFFQNLIGLKLRHSGKYTPVFPAANSYGKMVANVMTSKSGTSSFM